MWWWGTQILNLVLPAQVPLGLEALPIPDMMEGMKVNQSLSHHYRDHIGFSEVARLGKSRLPDLCTMGSCGFGT
jgi:hypothetical protein